ncbi:MAG: transposase [Chthoniobacter sp.]|nr:transposase [Chthoniobacter sp.]
MKQPPKASPQVCAGLDVGATELVVALLRDGQPEPTCTLPNTPTGHRQLLQLLTRRGATARVCLEATGVYSLNLALALQRAARVEVMVVNPRAIKDFQRARLTRLSLQQVSRRLLQLRAELTREQARLHAVEFTPDRDGLIAADLRANIRHLQKRIKALQQSAAALAAREPELAAQVARLRSVPGIGELSALKLLGELLVLPTGLKAKQWVAHAGLDPRPRQSGATDAPRHISRTGNRHLRLALFMPALVAIQRSPQIRAAYEALLARGKKKKVALVAIMRRLLHAIWGMLHHSQDFNPQLFHADPIANS